MEFLGKDLPNVAIPHTDIVHNLTENVVVVRLDQPVTFHNMIAPDKEVQVSLLFFIINNTSSRPNQYFGPTDGFLYIQWKSRSSIKIR